MTSATRLSSTNFVLALGGYVAYLVSLFLHTSDEPDILGLYTLRYAIFLGIATVPLLAMIILLGIKRKQAFSSLSRLFSSFCQVSGGLELCVTITILGTLALATPIVFADGISGFLLLFLAVAFLGVSRLLYSSNRQRFIRLIQQLALVPLGIIFALPVAEASLRLLSTQGQYTVRRANLYFEYHPVDSTMPGVSGTSVFSTDAYGIRGDPYQGQGRYNILAVGGSSTEGLYLDNAEA